VYKIIYIFIISTILILLSSCANSNLPKKSNNISKLDTIYELINSSSLDKAGELYVELKDSEDQPAIKRASSALAIAHIGKEEYILANFYLQEALATDSSDEFLKFLLVKNQFLSANLHSRDQSYMKRALGALEANRYLVIDSDYQILSNTMLTKVKLDMAWNNREVGNLYKRMNKPDAYKLYTQKIENLGFNIEDIIKY